MRNQMMDKQEKRDRGEKANFDAARGNQNAASEITGVAVNRMWGNWLAIEISRYYILHIAHFNVYIHKTKNLK